MMQINDIGFQRALRGSLKRSLDKSTIITTKAAPNASRNWPESLSSPGLHAAGVLDTARCGLHYAFPGELRQMDGF